MHIYVFPYMGVLRLMAFDGTSASNSSSTHPTVSSTIRVPRAHRWERRDGNIHSTIWRHTHLLVVDDIRVQEGLRNDVEEFFGLRLELVRLRWGGRGAELTAGLVWMVRTHAI